ncbi:MAG: hypothetical protein ACYDCN_07080 [Bacteroidia bacterium]
MNRKSINKIKDSNYLYLIIAIMATGILTFIANQCTDNKTCLLLIFIGSIVSFYIGHLQIQKNRLKEEFDGIKRKAFEFPIIDARIIDGENYPSLITYILIKPINYNKLKKWKDLEWITEHEYLLVISYWRNIIEFPKMYAYYKEDCREHGEILQIKGMTHNFEYSRYMDFRNYFAQCIIRDNLFKNEDKINYQFYLDEFRKTYKPTS